MHTSKTQYKGTPLHKKLGIEAFHRVKTKNSPGNYLDLISPLPDGVDVSARLGSEVDIWHLFTLSKTELTKELPIALKEIKQGGTIWVSWPKRSAKLDSDVTEDTVRTDALSLGLVEIKECTLDSTWSGLKLVKRKQPRNNMHA